ncbi:dihydrodipicolinate synthase family protein [Nonomuraea rubra]|uniref:Dihydrodipicolinate synthase/N-acetylneuraminate lyase n=1 Tax=Nonomuraea rubra TaxID=46180 RepID=A0A7X0NNY1_9ACTN|nr:hypothetical protein [Nonomuraea rubra]MBB6546955.1 dihydrodipicolinate synthase/N-acetylneuraminate lyase [Nonomuraea rubra]
MIRFLTGAAEVARGVPLVLQNPPHAKTQVPPRLLARALREVPQLIGVKMAGGDHAWYVEMTAAVPRPSIFVPGHLLATGLARGADGSYSNIAAMSPRGAVAWYRLMTTDPAAVLDVERRIGEFFRLHITPLQGPDCPTRLGNVPGRGQRLGQHRNDAALASVLRSCRRSSIHAAQAICERS